MRSFWVFIIFLIWGGVMTPISILLSRHYRTMDAPDPRKTQRVPVPRGAGIVLWSGMLLWSLLFADATYELRILMTGSTVVFFAGYLDDMLSLSPFVRLGVQFGAAALSLMAVGEQNAMYMGLLLFWVAGTTNAYNFIDGMNGLSISMSSITLIFLLLANGSTWAVPLLAMMAGIFFWNFPKAQTYMGDGGVYFIGYFIASLIMLWLVPMKMSLVDLCASLLLLGGVPVLDTLVVILRRVRNGKSPFYPDRTHIHHRLLDKRLSCPQVLLMLCVLQSACMVLAFAFLKLRNFI